MKSKVALVTGGSHGIGKAICIALANDGYDIAFCARGERYDLSQTSDAILLKNKRCSAFTINITYELNIRDMVNSILDKFNRIDVLINNVGGGNSWGNNKDWHLTSIDTWNEVMTQNLMSAVALTNLVIPNMVKNEFGRVITISSAFGKEAVGNRCFQTAKSAQISFMKSMASNKKYASKNITFNTVCPGFIDMPDKKIPESYLKSIPSGRFGNTNDISELVSFLCSDKASYINGSCIVVDGGYTKSF